MILNNKDLENSMKKEKEINYLTNNYKIEVFV